MCKKHFSFTIITFLIVVFVSACHTKKKPRTQRQTYTEYLQSKKNKTNNRTYNNRPNKNPHAENNTPAPPKTKGSKGFYDSYSKKLGVDFNGNEDKELIKEIETWIGTKYKYGGTSKSGTDCSGFVKTVYKKIYNIDLNRSARDLVKNTRLISKSQLKCGDLVFFKINKPQVSHVGIYLANNKFVHASSSRGVVVSDLTATYYTKHFYKGGRINM